MSIKGVIWLKKYFIQGDIDKLNYFIENKNEKEVFQIILSGKWYIEDREKIDWLEVERLAGGVAKCYRINGDLFEVSEYLNGKKHGKLFRYFENNIISEQSDWKYDKLDGCRILKHINGAKRVECTFINGELDGKYTFYYDNGIVAEESNYANGIKSGHSIKRHENGDVYEEVTWK